MQESRTLEFKEEISRSFLKTVSAYANFGTGDILFGVDDSGHVKGLAGNLTEERLRIENAINDALKPVPSFRLREDPKKKTIQLTVEEGYDKPYLYNGKAYRRSDTATIAVDTHKLRQLVLEGENRSYDSLPARRQDLTFNVLEQKCKELLQVATLSKDVFKTLGLWNAQGGFTIAAELTADKNTFPGVDIVRFGKTEDIIKDRITIKGTSVFQLYDQAVEFFYRYYREEVISGIQRSFRYFVPEKAFREALANALVHRDWDVQSNIQISMFDDHIIILSAGGLPSGISPETFVRGGLSVPRNPILANLFFRLNYIELFGTGIPRIRREYQMEQVQPGFEASEDTIRIILPCIGQRQPSTSQEEELLALFADGAVLTAAQIAAETGFSKAKVNRLLHDLLQKNKISRLGNGRSTRYRRE